VSRAAPARAGSRGAAPIPDSLLRKTIVLLRARPGSDATPSHRTSRPVG